MNRKKMKFAATPRRRQAGVVLWITLVVLVVLLAASVLIVRNTSLGQGIAGNLGFKRNATLAGDLGTEAARAWLVGRSLESLFSDVPAQGYTASWQVLSDDPGAFDWSEAVAVAGGTGGNSVSYLIHRMCLLPGRTEGQVEEGGVVLGTQECVFVSNATPDRTGGSQASGLAPVIRNPFYRVTSRIAGPRNTVSYVQTMLY